jgi:hypothetical protein
MFLPQRCLQRVVAALFCYLPDPCLVVVVGVVVLVRLFLLSLLVVSC